jgi:hypothetical protein
MAPIKLFAVASQGVRLGRNAEYAKIGRIVDNGECVRYCSFELSHGLHLATNLNFCLVLAQQAAKPMRASKGVSELFSQRRKQAFSQEMEFTDTSLQRADLTALLVLLHANLANAALPAIAFALAISKPCLPRPLGVRHAAQYQGCLYDVGDNRATSRCGCLSCIGCSILRYGPANQSLTVGTLSHSKGHLKFKEMSTTGPSRQI